MKRILFSFVLLAAVLLFGEFMCRLHFFRRIPGQNMPETFLAKAGLFLSGGSYVFEFRDQTFLINKPANVFRVLAIGGSSTECFYVDYRKGWPYLLGEKLNSLRLTDKKIEVVNLGLVGAASGEEYFNLVTHYDLAKPDLVIVYDGYNDIMGANLTYATYLLRQAQVYDILSRRKLYLKVRHFLNKNSALYNRLAANLHDFKSSINKFIFKHKLMGIGSQSRRTNFADFRWYRNAEFLRTEMDYVTGKLIQDKIYSEETRQRFSKDEYAIVEKLLEECVDKKGEVNVDKFLGQLIKSELEEDKKRRILDILGLNEIRFTVGELVVKYSPLDITQNARMHMDLLPEVYKYNLENIARFCREKDVALLLIFQPFLAEKLLRFGVDLNTQTFQGMSTFGLKENQHVAKVYPLRREKMKEVAEKYGVPFFNFQYIFDKYENKDVYLDSCHNTEFGLEYLAQRVAEAVEQSSLIGKSE